ncbi:MAG: hypothetical protein K2X47_13745 [Bdellovibrionales bacterium]|nr:hypothetical protein [Bdellovibrionales bacterium]
MAGSSSLAGNDPGDQASYKAINFVPAARLTEMQHRILTTYLAHPTPGPVPGLDHDDFRGVDANFDEWNQSYDGRAATFLAVTHALSLTIFHLSEGKDLLAINMVKDLKRTLGDRLIVTLQKDLFENWQTAGGKYTFKLANGRTETGNMKVNSGSSMGGSLHKGYDRQGFTSNSKVPRLQINYRDSDSEADIDLDGYAPMKFGFLPNPNHLTWENSDVRYWYQNYVRKFGNPGFEVSKRTSRAAKP